MALPLQFDYFENRVHDVAVEHRRRINMQIHERFRIRDNFDPLSMSITEFIKLYRMPQRAAVEMCNTLMPYIPPRRSPNQTPFIRRFLVALSFLATGSYQRLVGRSIDCSVSQASVSRYIHESVMALNHPNILTRYIRFPLTHEERLPIIRRNEEMGMERVLAFLDGFLLRLSWLPINNERQAFFTRKGWTGLNNQVLCDADLNILSIDSRFPGSVNDRTLWEASTAREVVEEAYWEDRCWVLGDSGYYTAPWLHVPVLDAAEDTPEWHYTRLHAHCRNCVERCIGLLKARWRILSSDRAVNYKSAGFAGCIVNACSVLHNFCNSRRVGVLAPLIEADDPPEFPDYNNLPVDLQRLGLAERNFLINQAYERRNQVVHAL